MPAAQTQAADCCSTAVTSAASGEVAAMGAGCSDSGQLGVQLVHAHTVARRAGDWCRRRRAGRHGRDGRHGERARQRQQVALHGPLCSDTG